MTQFEIPKPYVVWCHLCNKGFLTIEESQQHDKDFINKHQTLNAQRREDGKAQTQTPKS